MRWLRALTLTGLAGVLLAVPLCCWLVGVALGHLRGPDRSPRRAICFLAMAGTVGAIIALYFVGYVPSGPTGLGRSPGTLR